MSFFNYSLLVACIAGMFGASTDIPLSWTSPVFPKLYSNDSSINPFGKPITEDQNAWIGSLLTIGAVIGPFPFCYIAEKFGRKIGILCASIPIIVSFFTLAFARDINLYYLARVLAGLSMGAGYAILPTYIAEISEDFNRGMMSQILNVFWNTGHLMSYAAGPYLSLKLFNILNGCIPLMFFVLFILLAPETPYSLVKHNKTEQAAKSLMLLRSQTEENIQEELLKIKESNKEEENGSISDLLTSSILRRALVICIVLITTQEFSGFVAILFYMQLIFESAGSTLSSDVSALIVAIFLIISSLINPFLVDSLGRRILTIVSCFGMFFALTALGAFFFVQASTTLGTDYIFWLPIVSVVIFIFSYNFGISSIPFTLISEMFPSYVKQVACMITSTVSWTTSFFVTKYFNSLNNGIGQSGTFWVFASCCLATGLFSVLFVPETKGKSFSEIQEMLQSEGILQFGKQRKTSNVLKEIFEDPITLIEQ